MSLKISYGAVQAVKNCVKLQPTEKVVIITDRETNQIGLDIYHVANRISSGNVKKFMMEDYGERPNNESEGKPLEFPSDIGEAIKSADVSFYVASGKFGELQSFRNPMLDLINSRGDKIRHAHMPGITSQLMEEGMSVDYENVQSLTAKVIGIMKGARYVNVTNKAGTDLVVELSPDYKWLADDGLIKPGDFGNLPAGEAYTCALNAFGRIVVDGVLGDYFSEKYGLIHETPLSMKVEAGRVVLDSLGCENMALLNDFKTYVQQDENANRIGEFAIGTNVGLAKLVGNLLQDEKFPGVHVAFGHGYPEETGADWKSKAHIDAVLRDVNVVIDGKITLLRNGNFVNIL